MREKILSGCEKFGYAFGYTLGFFFVVAKKMFGI